MSGFSTKLIPKETNDYYVAVNIVALWKGPNPSKNNFISSLGSFP